MLELACSRCLEPFELPVDASFDVRYLPQSENTGDEREVEEDDLSDAFYRDEQIDLGQLMEEQFYLALPMKPLCREDCKGLCASCGTNLNEATCDCQVRWEDPRLAGLESADQPGQRRCLIQNDDIQDPRPQAPHARRLARHDRRQVPAVRRAEGAAHRVPLLRLTTKSDRFDRSTRSSDAASQLPVVSCQFKAGRIRDALL